MDEPIEAQLSAEIGRLVTEHQRYAHRLNDLKHQTLSFY